MSGAHFEGEYAPNSGSGGGGGARSEASESVGTIVGSNGHAPRLGLGAAGRSGGLGLGTINGAPVGLGLGLVGTLGLPILATPPFATTTSASTAVSNSNRERPLFPHPLTSSSVSQLTQAPSTSTITAGGGGVGFGTTVVGHHMAGRASFQPSGRPGASRLGEGEDQNTTVVMSTFDTVGLPFPLKNGVKKGKEGIAVRVGEGDGKKPASHKGEEDNTQNTKMNIHVDKTQHTSGIDRRRSVGGSSDAHSSARLLGRSAEVDTPLSLSLFGSLGSGVEGDVRRERNLFGNSNDRRITQQSDLHLLNVLSGENKDVVDFRFSTVTPIESRSTLNGGQARDGEEGHTKGNKNGEKLSSFFSFRSSLEHWWQDRGGGGGEGEDGGAMLSSSSLKNGRVGKNDGKNGSPLATSESSSSKRLPPSSVDFSSAFGFGSWANHFSKSVALLLGGYKSKSVEEQFVSRLLIDAWSVPCVSVTFILYLSFSLAAAHLAFELDAEEHAGQPNLTTTIIRRTSTPLGGTNWWIIPVVLIYDVVAAMTAMYQFRVVRTTKARYIEWVRNVAESKRETVASAEEEEGKIVLEGTNERRSGNTNVNNPLNNGDDDDVRESFDEDTSNDDESEKRRPRRKRKKDSTTDNSSRNSEKTREGGATTATYAFLLSRLPCSASDARRFEWVSIAFYALSLGVHFVHATVTHSSSSLLSSEVEPILVTYLIAPIVFICLGSRLRFSRLLLLTLASMAVGYGIGQVKGTAGSSDHHPFGFALTKEHLIYSAVAIFGALLIAACKEDAAREHFRRANAIDHSLRTLRHYTLGSRRFMGDVLPLPTLSRLLRGLPVHDSAREVSTVCVDFCGDISRLMLMKGSRNKGKISSASLASLVGAERLLGLLRELEDEAKLHQVDVGNVSGDAFWGTCGLHDGSLATQHGLKVARFAISVISWHPYNGVGLRIGCHCGPMASTILSGHYKLDIVGAGMNISAEVAASAAHGTIVATDAFFIVLGKQVGPSVMQHVAATSGMWRIQLKCTRLPMRVGSFDSSLLDGGSISPLLDLHRGPAMDAEQVEGFFDTRVNPFLTLQYQAAQFLKLVRDDSKSSSPHRSKSRGGEHSRLFCFHFWRELGFFRNFYKKRRGREPTRSNDGSSARRRTEIAVVCAQKKKKKSKKAKKDPPPSQRFSIRDALHSLTGWAIFSKTTTPLTSTSEEKLANAGERSGGCRDRGIPTSAMIPVADDDYGKNKDEMGTITPPLSDFFVVRPNERIDLNAREGCVAGPTLNAAVSPPPKHSSSFVLGVGGIGVGGGSLSPPTPSGLGLSFGRNGVLGARRLPRDDAVLPSTMVSTGGGVEGVPVAAGSSRGARHNTAPRSNNSNILLSTSAPLPLPSNLVAFAGPCGSGGGKQNDEDDHLPTRRRAESGSRTPSSTTSSEDRDAEDNCPSNSSGGGGEESGSLTSSNSDDDDDNFSITDESELDNNNKKKEYDAFHVKEFDTSHYNYNDRQQNHRRGEEAVLNKNKRSRISERSEERREGEGAAERGNTTGGSSVIGRQSGTLSLPPLHPLERDAAILFYYSQAATRLASSVLLISVSLATLIVILADDGGDEQPPVGIALLCCGVFIGAVGVVISVVTVSTSSSSSASTSSSQPFDVRPRESATNMLLSSSRGSTEGERSSSSFSLSASHEQQQHFSLSQSGDERDSSSVVGLGVTSSSSSGIRKDGIFSKLFSIAAITTTVFAASIIMTLVGAVLCKEDTPMRGNLSQLAVVFVLLWPTLSGLRLRFWSALTTAIIIVFGTFVLVYPFVRRDSKELRELISYGRNGGGGAGRGRGREGEEIHTGVDELETTTAILSATAAATTTLFNNISSTATSFAAEQTTTNGVSSLTTFGPYLPPASSSPSSAEYASSLAVLVLCVLLPGAVCIWLEHYFTSRLYFLESQAMLQLISVTEQSRLVLFNLLCLFVPTHLIPWALRPYGLEYLARPIIAQDRETLLILREDFGYAQNNDPAADEKALVTMPTGKTVSDDQRRKRRRKNSESRSQNSQKIRLNEVDADGVGSRGGGGRTPRRSSLSSSSMSSSISSSSLHPVLTPPHQFLRFPVFTFRRIVVCSIFLNDNMAAQQVLATDLFFHISKVHAWVSEGLASCPHLTAVRLSGDIITIAGLGPMCEVRPTRPSHGKLASLTRAAKEKKKSRTVLISGGNEKKSMRTVPTGRSSLAHVDVHGNTNSFGNEQDDEELVLFSKEQACAPVIMPVQPVEVLIEEPTVSCQQPAEKAFSFPIIDTNVERPHTGTSKISVSRQAKAAALITACERDSGDRKAEEEAPCSSTLAEEDHHASSSLMLNGKHYVHEADQSPPHARLIFTNAQRAEKDENSDAPSSPSPSPPSDAVAKALFVPSQQPSAGGVMRPNPQEEHFNSTNSTGSSDAAITQRKFISLSAPHTLFGEKEVNHRGTAARNIHNNQYDERTDHDGTVRSRGSRLSSLYDSASAEGWIDENKPEEIIVNTCAPTTKGGRSNTGKEFLDDEKILRTDCHHREANTNNRSHHEDANNIDRSLPAGASLLPILLSSSLPTPFSSSQSAREQHQGSDSFVREEEGSDDFDSDSCQSDNESSTDGAFGGQGGTSATLFFSEVNPVPISDVALHQALLEAVFIADTKRMIRGGGARGGEGGALKDYNSRLEAKGNGHSFSDTGDDGLDTGVLDLKSLASSSPSSLPTSDVNTSEGTSTSNLALPSSSKGNRVRMANISTNPNTTSVGSRGFSVRTSLHVGVGAASMLGCASNVSFDVFGPAMSTAIRTARLAPRDRPLASKAFVEAYEPALAEARRKILSEVLMIESRAFLGRSCSSASPFREQHQQQEEQLNAAAKDMKEASSEKVATCEHCKEKEEEGRDGPAEANCNVPRSAAVTVAPSGGCVGYIASGAEASCSVPIGFLAASNQTENNSGKSNSRSNSNPLAPLLTASSASASCSHADTNHYWNTCVENGNGDLTSNEVIASSTTLAAGGGGGGEKGKEDGKAKEQGQREGTTDDRAAEPSSPTSNEANNILMAARRQMLRRFVSADNSAFQPIAIEWGSGVVLQHPAESRSLRRAPELHSTHERRRRRGSSRSRLPHSGEEGATEDQEVPSARGATDDASVLVGYEMLAAVPLAIAVIRSRGMH